MKKFALVCAFVLGASVATFAQNGGGGGRMRMEPKAQVASLKEKITTITDDQAAKLLVVYTDAAKKRDSTFTAMRDGGGGGDRAAMMEVFTKMQTATDVKIKGVLTADQAKAYQKISDEAAAARKARMQGN
ncbi:hypothetical protein [Mucilaginibacter antarcticus]|uniref:LTXXQ motif family protein n=1 Tax=Mucilaginibacter antarcticus TaxID=1855725 RepID=A0ABW5XS50_9SPHI